MARLLSGFLFLALLLATPSLRAEDDVRTAALRAVDDVRVAAFLAGQASPLQAVLSDELHYAHASGNVDTKATLTEALTSGKLHYTALDYVRRDFTFPAPGIALMRGQMHLQVKSAAGETDAQMSFLAVWREEGGAWKFLAWQSAKMPAPAK